MSELNLKGRNFIDEFVFKASRSSGAGGQNVNKVNTKVELRFNIKNSQLLSDVEKELMLKKLFKKINIQGELIIISQTDRSQLKNKENTIEKFYLLMKRALTLQPKRKVTKPTKASIEKRLEDKQKRSYQKLFRKKMNTD